MTPDELGQLLDELGRRLGPGGEYVFRLAVQRVVISSAAWAVGSGAVLVAFGLYLRFVARDYRAFTPKDTGYSSDDDWFMSKGMPLALGVLLFGMAAAFAGIAFLTSIVNLLTPEYTALRDILSAIGAAR